MGGSAVAPGCPGAPLPGAPLPLRPAARRPAAPAPARPVLPGDRERPHSLPMSGLSFLSYSRSSLLRIRVTSVSCDFGARTHFRLDGASPRASSSVFPDLRNGTKRGSVAATAARPGDPDLRAPAGRSQIAAEGRARRESPWVRAERDGAAPG